MSFLYDVYAYGNRLIRKNSIMLLGQKIDAASGAPVDTVESALPLGDQDSR